MHVDYEDSKRELECDWGVLRYHEAGSPDAPPLILLHGSGPGVTGWRNYRGNVGTFAEHFHTYIVEFPGFGVSDSDGGFPVLSAGKSVVTFMRALGLESAPMIGNSMGGVVGINLAIRKPELVSKLVTIGGVGPNLLSPSPSEGIRLLQEMADAPDRDKLVRWLRAMVFDPGVVTDELIEERWEAATHPDAAKTARDMYGSAAFAMQQQFLAASEEPPYWARMGKVQCPVLLTWGLDDRVSPPDMSLAPLRMIPDAQLHVFGNCGHWVMIEAKEAFEKAVLGFLS
ncbi:alpha/beta fold hydrolase [Nocardioides acrostichi]|uniref:Alpha/beta fold hydrolase n=1 Tax=Nocardioides acrostichi TaxID=2784339 RepID=A0A930V4P3_9ACTN|nr:alpha/beta fold hydrolase [Nocardioides acrostichi]MBF4163786.1 alpha/beta fold hydrolase [Nocardioides acrostichi]